MNNNYKTFYHLQIAKCGGTYLNNMVINPISNILLNNNINIIDGKYHIGWQEAEKIYIVSSLRDPVKRTVSHYTYRYKDFSYISNNDTLNFIDWVKKYKNFISNYQIKNFLYTYDPTLLKYNLNLFVPEKNKDFMSVELNKNFAIEKVKKINVLLKDSQLNDKVCNSVAKKILKDFDILGDIKINKNKQHDNNVNKHSLEIYNKLTKKEIDYLYEINNIDSEIYFSEELYFNNKN